MATRKKPRAPLSERSITAMLMKAHEMAQADPPAYPFWSRELLADPELLDHAPCRAIALKIIAAYAAEHPLPLPGTEDVVDCVNWKLLVGGGMTLREARRQVAEETSKSYAAVKLIHTRACANRIKRGPR